MAEQNFVTKTDLQLESTNIRSEIRRNYDELKSEIQLVKTEIQTVKLELTNKIESQGDKIVIRLGAMMVGISTILSIVFGVLK
jgi:hypothetical protein